LTLDDDGRDTQGPGRPGTLVLVVAVVAALVIGAVSGVLLLRPEQTPGDTSPEAGFARDMSVHHTQAVSLAFMAYNATDDEEVRQLAYDIINTQRAQVGMFSGWLQQWDLPQTSTASPMAWMSHGHSDVGSATGVDSYDDMPGMATDEQLEQLASLEGVAAEREFLELMIDHHLGGVEMAEAVIPLTERDEVQRLAQTIVNGQQAEVATMEQMLQDRS
jgi:uncharacterized protein (DUF305 family)